MNKQNIPTISAARIADCAFYSAKDFTPQEQVEFLLRHINERNYSLFEEHISQESDCGHAPVFDQACLHRLMNNVREDRIREMYMQRESLLKNLKENENKLKELDKEICKL